MKEINRDDILRSFKIKLMEDIKYHFRMKDPQGLFEVLSGSVDLVQDKFMYHNGQDSIHASEYSAGRLGKGMLDEGITHQSTQFQGERIDKFSPNTGVNVITTSAIVLKHRKYIEDCSNRPKYD